MNRGQVKRLRKELDRMRSGGKEWDALRLLEREGAVDDFRVEWDDLWRTQARHALRTSELMEGFLSRVNEFTTIPDTADIRFMRMIGDHLDGRDVISAIQGVTGLSAPAETLRRELLRRGNEKAPDDTKLRKLLTSFATAPESALQKDYRQLRTLLSSYPAISQSACETLEELLTRVRRFNSASAAKNKISGVTEGDLNQIDLALKNTAPKLPHPFFRVVAAPVMIQVCGAIRRIAEISPDQGARLALAAPFCMEIQAGPDWPGMQKKFQLEAARALTTADRANLRKTAQAAGFEERFTLINKLTRLMSSQQKFDMDLQDTLVILYKGIFKELAVRRATISEREQRKLAAVFGPVFSKHVPYLCGSMEDIPYLLDSAASVGCLNAPSALLHTFFATMSRDRSMIANARAMLKLLPPIQEKDVRELFGEYREFLVKDLKALKGMLDICHECGHEPDFFIAKGVNISFLSSLITNTLMSGGGRNSFANRLIESMSGESSRECKKMINEMKCFAGNPAFSVSTTLADGFPSGKLSGTEFKQLMERQLDVGISSEKAVDSFITLLQMIKQLGERELMDIPLRGMLCVDSLVQELFFAGLDAFCGKKEQIVRHSTEALAALVALIRSSADSRGLDRYMLLIGNVSAERMQTGDEAARKLYENTTNYITRNKRLEKKRGRQR